MREFPQTSATSVQTWFARPLIALLLLFVEYLSISFGFESLPQLKLPGDDGSALSHLHLIGPAVIAWGTAFVLLSRSEARDTFRRALKTPRLGLGPALILQLGCFALFFFITSKVFGSQAPAGDPRLWLTAWLIALVATGATLLSLAMGAFELRTVLHELGRPIALAALLGLVAFSAGLATLGLWARLSDWTLVSVAALLGLLLDPTVQDLSHAIVGTERFKVAVSPVCSGYEGIGLVAVFLSVYFFAYRRQLHFPRVLVLLVAGVVLVWALNIVRIVALIGLGHIGYPGIALGGFHSKAGWLVSCAVVLGAVWLSQSMDWFAREPAKTRARVVNPSLPFLLPLLAIVATSMVSGLFVTDFDYFYPARVFVALLLLGFFGRQYANGLRRQLAGRALWSSEAFALGVLVFFGWLGMAALTQTGAVNQAPPELLALSSPRKGFWLAARVLGASLTIPIAEELAFRGFLLRRLINRDFNSVSYRTWSWPAVLISSLAFALVHQSWLAAFFAGLVYAYAQYRRGLLSDAILAHAVTNALIAAQVLIGGQWSLW